MLVPGPMARYRSQKIYCRFSEIMVPGGIFGALFSDIMGLIIVYNGTGLFILINNGTGLSSVAEVPPISRPQNQNKVDIWSDSRLKCI